MTEESLISLLASVADGSLGVGDAMERLRTLPYTEVTASLLDTHRTIRQGMPEVVFARHKTAQQVVDALAGLATAHGHALATHVSAEMAVELSWRFPEGTHEPVSRLFRIGRIARSSPLGPVAVVCAGTSDLPVGEEAAQTLEFAGADVLRINDVGVAGLHRLLGKLDMLRACRVIIAVAGMEGALPGVISGLVSQPVVAVPTSVGYGASYHGLSALLTMLNACASGMGVVNIDNGFGAAMLALRIMNSGKTGSAISA